MAARTSAPGLSTADLEVLREAVAAGRRQRVVFTEAAGQVAGQTGHVVGLTDPELTDEWVVVRFGRDELPFAPPDLRLATRSSARANGASAPVGRTTVPPVSGASAPGSTATRPPGTSLAPQTAPANDALAGPTARAPSANGSAAAPPSQVDGAAPAGSARGAPRRATNAKPPAALTVTLTHIAGAWTVGVSQGAKTLLKPCAVKAREALSMVTMVDVPAVRDVVERIVAAERAEAQRQAGRLRRELAEVEARLAELVEQS